MAKPKIVIGNLKQLLDGIQNDVEIVEMDIKLSNGLVLAVFDREKQGLSTGTTGAFYEGNIAKAKIL